MGWSDAGQLAERVIYVTIMPGVVQDDGCVSRTPKFREWAAAANWVREDLDPEWAVTDVRFTGRHAREAGAITLRGKEVI
jgi:hypothetical protein